MKLKTLLFGAFLLQSTLSAELETTISNTNFTLSTGSYFPSENRNYLYNYDRLRLKSDYTNGDYFTCIIADGVNYLGYDYIHSLSFFYLKQIVSDTPFKTQSSFSSYDEGTSYVKLYRLYTGYEDSKNKLIAGLQKISMGVGRIWTPTNLFNPKNSFALEPDEVFPVLALNYTRHLSSTSELMFVSSQKADESFKNATRFKRVFDTVEIAIDAISSDKTGMLGLEIEGDLYDTGIEVRMEAVYIETKLLDSLNIEKEHYFAQGILGADYGFKNGITMVLEAYYSSQTFDYTQLQENLHSEILSSLTLSNFYLGATLSYGLNLYLDASLVYIESFNDQNSRFISPTLKYTLNDYNNFTLGAMIGNGLSGSEYGVMGNSYYLRYSLSF